MAMGNGKGSLVPELLSAVHDLRGELRAHVDSTEMRFGAMETSLANIMKHIETLAGHMRDSVRETRERFERMDIRLERVARVVTDFGAAIDDHEDRLQGLEGR